MKPLDMAERKNPREYKQNVTDPNSHGLAIIYRIWLVINSWGREREEGVCEKERQMWSSSWCGFSLDDSISFQTEELDSLW